MATQKSVSLRNDLRGVDDELRRVNHLEGKMCNLR
ncbi:Uncharacterised protein [Enterobacter hormaechei]|nr:Uncharacterised protein [Enterobacter hormaechei]VAF78218.1 Uncharacterised protein [Enterobacter hormaechei]